MIGRGTPDALLPIMKTFRFAVLALTCGSALVYAEPDFTLRASDPPAPAVDPDLTASDADTAIEPETLITFALDSDQLDAMAASQVATVARWMKAHPHHSLAVQGYADRLGAHPHNEGLAKRRAERVRMALVQSGVPADRLVIAVYGDRVAHPIEDESDRRAVLFASRRSVQSLATTLLASTKADEVEWTSRGAQLQERLGR